MKICKKLLNTIIDYYNWNYNRGYAINSNFSYKAKIEYLHLSHNIYWAMVSEELVLSEYFIRKFQDKVNWYYVSKSQRLSEDFIREFKDKVHWKMILRYQNLPDNFVIEFEDGRRISKNSLLL